MTQRERERERKRNKQRQWEVRVAEHKQTDQTQGVVKPTKCQI